jgi:hypothetical protein
VALGKILEHQVRAPVCDSLKHVATHISASPTSGSNGLPLSRERRIQSFRIRCPSRAARRLQRLLAGTGLSLDSLRGLEPSSQLQARQTVQTPGDGDGTIQPACATEDLRTMLSDPRKRRAESTDRHVKNRTHG